MRFRGAPLAAAFVMATVVLGACGGTAVPAPPSAAPAAPSGPAPIAPQTPAGPTTSPSTAAPPPASATASSSLASGSPGADTVMDPTLLALLPDAIGTARVEIEPDSFAQAIGDASFVSNVDRAAFAVVAGGDDLASGVVAHLRPGVYSDAFYRDWRDSYDTGACDQADGVAAHAQATLGGRPVFITSCAGGLRVYHAWVPEREVIVSLISLGAARFGEQLVAGIRP